MSEQVQSAGVAQPKALTAVDGAKLLAEQRAKAAQPNPVSEAARTLGQRAAEARKTRTTETAQVSETSQEEEEERNVEDEQPGAGDKPQDETVTTETPEADDAEGQDNPDTGAIDLGEGVKLTKDEIRENIMLKADHTKRLMALAEDRKAFESKASQKLTLMEKAIELLSQRIGPPKPLSQFVREMGDPALATEAFEQQQQQLQAVFAGRELVGRQKTDHMQSTLANRDKALADSYNKEWSDPEKRDQAYTDISAYALKVGATAEELSFLPSPWMIQVLDKAMKYDAGQADKSRVTKLVAGKPLVVKPGTKQSAGSAAQNNLQSAQAHLKKSGNLTDALAVLKAQRAARG